MEGIAKGLVIGGCNVLVIAIGIAAIDHHAQLVMLVTFMGILPGLIAGAILGSLASRMRSSHVALRVTVLFLPAFLVVVMLATEFAMQDLVFVSSIPTLVSVLVLERCTRHVELPPVPPARIR